MPQARKNKPVFNPKGPFVCGKKFIAEGKEFKPGDNFDVSHRAISVRRLKAMYDHNMIKMKPNGTAAIEEPKGPAIEGGADSVPYVREHLTAMSKPEVVKICKANDLPHDGEKSVLIERILEAGLKAE